MTLVELLATIALLSIVAGLGVRGLAVTDARASLLSVSAEWRDLDARARLLSRTGAGGSVTMILSSEPPAIRLVSMRTREVLAAVPVHDQVVVEIESANGARRVAYDQAGRSADYEISFSMDDRSLRWRVHGLTGQVLRLEERLP